MAQKKHLDDFYVVELLDDVKCGRTQLEVSEGIAQSVISMLWQRFQDDAQGTRYHQENTVEQHRYGGAGIARWGGIHSWSQTLTCMFRGVTMTGHIY
ncbi:uncharacterized protein TNCV_4927901 [Trichonephila clavipes]|nr:uncharacterized protein TNCV_4927901 [Trichonephila clavipes]